MSPKAEECRQKAAKNHRLASAAGNLQSRAAFELIAGSWKQLADDFEWFEKVQAEYGLSPSRRSHAHKPSGTDDPARSRNGQEGDHPE
jgi:hypothetical protein